MKSDQPFRKAFICAGAVALSFTIWLIANGADHIATRIGYVVGNCLIPAIAIGLWGWFSKTSWSWPRFILIYIIFFVLAAALAKSGRERRTDPYPQTPAEPSGRGNMPPAP